MVNIDIQKIIQTQILTFWTIDHIGPSGGLNDLEIYCTKILLTYSIFFFKKKGGQLFATIFFTKST